MNRQSGCSGTFKNVVLSMDDRSRANMHEQDFVHVSAQLTIDLDSLDTGMDVRIPTSNRRTSRLRHFSLEHVAHGWRVRTVTPITITSADFGFEVAALLERCMRKGLDPATEVQTDIFVKE